MMCASIPYFVFSLSYLCSGTFKCVPAGRCSLPCVRFAHAYFSLGKNKKGKNQFIDTYPIGIIKQSNQSIEASTCSIVTALKQYLLALTSSAFERLERQPMDRTGSIPMDRFNMFWNCIALVGAESILRITFGPTRCQSVPTNFGKNRR